MIGKIIIIGASDITEIAVAITTKQDVLTFDTSPTSGSNNPVTSDGIAAALAQKQDALTFDSTPTAESNNPVTSDGIKTALDAKQNTLTFDGVPVSGSSRPITSGAVYSALGGASIEKTTTITDESTDNQYPSAAAVWDLFASIIDAEEEEY